MLCIKMKRLQRFIAGMLRKGIKMKGLQRMVVNVYHEGKSSTVSTTTLNIHSEALVQWLSNLLRRRASIAIAYEEDLNGMDIFFVSVHALMRSYKLQ